MFKFVSDRLCRLLRYFSCFNHIKFAWSAISSRHIGYFTWAWHDKLFLAFFRREVFLAAERYWVSFLHVLTNLSESFISLNCIYFNEIWWKELIKWFRSDAIFTSQNSVPTLLFNRFLFYICQILFLWISKWFLSL